MEGVLVIWIVLLAAGLLVAGIGLFAVLLAALRWEYSPVLRRFTRMQRRFMNPRALRTAGNAGDPWSVVGHVGRSTGTSYETPVGALRTGDGFLISLPYGTSADWVKNVLAAGSATIRTEGQELRVRDPRVVPAAEVGRHFSGRDRLVNRIFGVDQFLVLKPVAADHVAGGEG